MITTHSLFYFGHTVDSSNCYLDFAEGGAELAAVLRTGEYTLSDFATEIARAMNLVGAKTYSTSVNRSTRKITITADSGTFQLKAATGSHVGSSPWALMGFAATDLSGSISYQGGSASGSSYATQFILQDYVASADNLMASDGVVNKAASGRVEVVRFGSVRLIEMNLRYITDRTMPAGAPIRNNATGVANARTLMEYLITKAPIEFIPDESSPGTFEKVILESTPADSKGIGHKLKELYTDGLPGFYETGVMKMRVIV